MVVFSGRELFCMRPNFRRWHGLSQSMYAGYDKRSGPYSSYTSRGGPAPISDNILNGTKEEVTI